MSLKEHKNVRELLYTIEEIRASYRTASGQDLSDELLVTTLEVYTGKVENSYSVAANTGYHL